MNCNHNQCSNRKRIFVVTSIVLTGLLVLDVIFQGEVYKRLPISWQNQLSEWIGR